uniref:hypothetical protein n=1 Tax=Malassezia brasiliensis TaxID=1821822 RepID=UPI0030032B5E|nr:hypothetical protein [Malassezia brasiliensis]
MFGGQVKSYPIKHVYQLQIKGVFNMDKIIHFLDQYELVANKKFYTIWKHENNKAKSNSGNKDNGLNNIRQVYFLFVLYLNIKIFCTIFKYINILYCIWIEKIQRWFFYHHNKT